MKTTEKLAVKSNALFLSQNFLNFVPLVCSLMVVLIHMYNAANLQPTSMPALFVSFFSHGLCTAAVPMFFFMSGYLFYRNINSIQDVFEKQRKRILSVLLPFIAWSSFYFLFYAVGTKVISGTQTVVDISPLGVLSGIIFYRYSFPMWYMFQLCIYILFAPVIYCILKSTRLSRLLLIVSISIAMFAIDSIEINVGEVKRAVFHFNFFAYYFAGCLFVRMPEAAEKIKRFVAKIHITILIITFLLFGFLESLFFEDIIGSFNSRCMVPFVFISFFILMLKICETEKKLPQSSVSTMIIYGIHSFVALILGKLVFANLNISTIMSYVLSFVLVATISYGIGYIMKFIKPLYFVFSGNR